MKMSMRGVLAVTLVLCLLIVPMMGASVWAVDLTRTCSVTATASGTDFADDVATANVVFDLYQIASAEATERGGLSLTPMPLYGNLDLEVEQDTDAWEALAQSAASIAIGNDVPVVTGALLGTKQDLPEAGLFLLIARGSDVTDYKITDPETGDLATIANSAEYEYQFAPVILTLPNWDAETSDWFYDLDATLKMRRIPRFGDLEIVKRLLTYEDSDTPTFVFKVVGELDGRTIYDDVVSLTFSDAAERSVLIEHLPVGATFTVTEIYSGASYQLVTSATQTAVIPSEDVVRVEFENEYTPTTSHGHGITNHFEYAADTSWGWTQLPDNGTE